MRRIIRYIRNRPHIRRMDKSLFLNFTYLLDRRRADRISFKIDIISTLAINIDVWNSRLLIIYLTTRIATIDSLHFSHHGRSRSWYYLITKIKLYRHVILLDWFTNYYIFMIMWDIVCYLDWMECYAMRINKWWWRYSGLAICNWCLIVVLDELGVYMEVLSIGRWLDIVGWLCYHKIIIF